MHELFPNAEVDRHRLKTAVEYADYVGRYINRFGWMNRPGERRRVGYRGRCRNGKTSARRGHFPKICTSEAQALRPLVLNHICWSHFLS